jgi:hypothetical protein
MKKDIKLVFIHPSATEYREKDRLGDSIKTLITFLRKKKKKDKKVGENRIGWREGGGRGRVGLRRGGGCVCFFLSAPPSWARASTADPSPFQLITHPSSSVR